MINDEELSLLLDIDSELNRIISDLKSKNEITSIYKSLLTWKVSHIKDDITKREEELINKKLNHKKDVTKKNIMILILAIITIGTCFYLNYFLFGSLLIPLFIIITIIYLIKSHSKNTEYAFISINKIYQNLELIKRHIDEKKVVIDKETKKIKEDLVIQIFNQASIDLEEMTNTENVNLNFKDRAYRNFIINLYDLKINEKELNSFYRKVVKLIILDDLSNSIEY
ncbi:MAG: hypothetical protein NC483_07715 [Ruminococcus sp.]|nr:hypothetical protein [Ruminococcus sp.]